MEFPCKTFHQMGLRACWWGYHMLIELFEGKMGKAEVGHINFGKAIEKLSTWSLWWQRDRF